MTTHKIIEQLSERVNLGEAPLKKFNDRLFDIITRELRQNDNFSIFGFGTFKKTFVKSTQGVHPQTGEATVIPAHYRIKFTPSSKVKARINAEYANLQPSPIDREELSQTLLTQNALYGRATEENRKLVLPGSKAGRKGKGHTLGEDSSWADPRVKKRLLTALLVFLLILLGAAGFLFVRLQSSENGENLKIVEAAPPPSVGEPSPPTPPQAVMEDYTVSPGESFSLVAEMKWNEVALWPYLYSKNQEEYYDPDRLYPGDLIRLPAKPDKEKDREVIEQSIIDVYIRFHRLIREQANNPRNESRRVNATYTLLEGERLYPDFINRRKDEVDPSEAERIRDILKR